MPVTFVLTNPAPVGKDRHVVTMPNGSHLELPISAVLAVEDAEFAKAAIEQGVASQLPDIVEAVRVASIEKWHSKQNKKLVRPHANVITVIPTSMTTVFEVLAAAREATK